MVDPVRNPFAPGAGQRPPELAGRDREVAAFDVVLERVSRSRPERSLVPSFHILRRPRVGDGSQLLRCLAAGSIAVPTLSAKEPAGIHTARARRT